jgi:hypothetical protein
MSFYIKQNETFYLTNGSGNENSSLIYLKTIIEQNRDLKDELVEFEITRAESKIRIASYFGGIS